MRYEAKMMPMFLTVYLSNNDQHFTEVPVTPETLCRDVVELCKEPGETDCHLSEMWRGSERAVGEGERMLDVLQRWGQHRAEVRFFLRHNRAPSRESGGSRGSEPKRNGVKGPPDRRMENGVVTPRMDMTLAELQEMAARQQQQIEAQQQLLASKEQRLRYLKQQEQRQQQQASEQEKLQRLRENIENQETRLKKVRALKGQVEQKRLSNGKLVEEIEQMNNLFQQKQRELVMAASKVEELSRQLELLKNGKMDNFHDNQSSVAELDRLYKELQLRNKLNQDQNSKLQQQRESLNKRNLEVAAMDKRINELRDRLWKKKAALQQKENLPPQMPQHSDLTHANNGYPGKERASKDTHLQPSDGQAGQQSGPSRVAAVGPYIQSSTMPRGPVRHDLLVKPAYPDGTATLPAHDPQTKAGAGLQPSKLADWSSSGPESNTNGHGASSTLPRMTSHSNSNTEQDETEMKRDRKVRPFSMFEPTEAPATSLRKNQSSDDLVRDAQSAPKGPVKVPPPVPTKPKGPGVVPYGKPGLNTGTFPKAKPHSQQPQAAQSRSPLTPSQSQTLPLPSKQDTPPAATVRPFTPELPSSKDASLSKPQTLAASSIYSMYTQQPGSGKPFQPGLQGTLNRGQSRTNGFVSVYGKPVIPSGGFHPENPYMDRRSPAPESEVDHNGSNNVGPSSSEGPQPETERIPRPLSPTKLLPFISNPYRHQSEGDLEALRKKLYNAPRPLKKRSSITEPEGPAGPNIQKLLYQKTTLAAMETTVTTPTTPTYTGEAEKATEGSVGPHVPSPLSGTENHPSETGQTLEGGLLPSHIPSASVPAPAEQMKPPSGILESEDIIPPPPPSHPAPRPDDALFPPPPPAGLEETIPNLPPPPPEGFLEEFPPYPPPPYPSGAEQDSLGEDTFNMKAPEVTGQVTLPPGKRTNLRKPGSERIDHSMRVKFNPLALLLDSSLEGEFDLVQRIIYEVEDPSQPNDEGITALHNAVCAGHTEIVKFLVQFGVNVNAADSDGWTPLHCAASCNNVQVCKFLVESGAAVFAMTYSDMQTAADKCEEMEEGYTQCSQFLYGVQEKMGIMNRGVVYGLWDYNGENPDELSFREGDCMTIIRREDEDEIEWWWARMGDTEGYIPRNLLGLYPRIKPRQRTLA
ncbi:apoptosis-stimulating of p53 protein 2 isoform X2 [Seriola lalandi dorsalis]|uniref:apoptosis-stimulating of p53 protein 2 isoform X2 n=1 Tax=Seriola lalandi dorsalis TaxID=1841481 RepID=UPI000C6FB4D5|nr:apoptosis-stimulating of p53 protein 2 isoform X2 [Seriola lalandi dorsalis]XP_056250709.1 apoptosis-stimulating of p53 protein 2a isoform X2 [Seriola aureovittata]